MCLSLRQVFVSVVMTEVATARGVLESTSEQALQMALELSMQNFSGAASAAMAASCGGSHGFQPYSGVLPEDADSQQRMSKSQNITQWVAVPSSEHVAEIVGRQGACNRSLRS